MSRTETIKTLVKIRSGEGEAISHPDHPLLLSGPSLLTLMDGVLTASFVYTVNSRSASTAAERARVLLARLAYPRHTVFEAIFENGVSRECAGASLFDTYRVGTPRALSQPDADDADRKRVASAIDKLRAPHFARFAANQEGAHGDHPHGARATFLQYSTDTASSYKFVNEELDLLSAHIPEGTRATTIRRLQRAAETFTANDYGLSIGVSALVDVAGAVNGAYFLKQHQLRANLSFSSEQLGSDDGKPRRAAQFAGGLVESAW